MKQFGDARKLISLLQRRSQIVRREVLQRREALNAVDLDIERKRIEIRGLQQKLAVANAGRRYVRSELMRARGKQAVIRYEIACRKVEESELIEYRSKLGDELKASQRIALTLEKRQNTHRDWLAKESLKVDLLREALVEAEILEGRVHGINPN